MERGPAEKDSVVLGEYRGSGVWSQPETWKDDLGLSLGKRPEETLWAWVASGLQLLAVQEDARPRGKWS